MRLIDVDTIIHYQTYDDECEEYLEHESTVADFLDGMTDEGCPNPVDAVPVKHGRWKRAYLDHVAMGERPSIFYCSVCNQCIAYPVNYCPSCGADMRGEQE